MHQLRRGLRRGYSIDGEDLAFDAFTGVAGRINHRDDGRVLAVRQGHAQIGQTQRPVAILVGLCFIGVAVDVHTDQRQGIGRARQRGGVVAGNPILTRHTCVVIWVRQQAASDGVCRRGRGVNGDHRRLCGRGIARQVIDRDLGRVLAIGQCRVRGQAPVTVLIRHRLKFLIAKNQVHHGACLSRALKGRLRIGGQAVIWQNTRVVDVVMNQVARGFIRADGIHLEGHALNRLTHITSQVSDRDQRGVHPICQSIGRDLPVAVLVCIRLKHVAINVHRHMGIGLRGARNHRRGVVGDAVLARRARVILRIVHQLRRGLRRSLCVNGDSRTIHAQLITGRVNVAVGRGVSAISQLPTLGHLDRPIPVVIRHRAVSPAIQLDHHHNVSLTHVTC